MTFYILGMGAIGSLFGVILHSNGHKVVGLCRREHFDSIKSKGLTFVNLEEREYTIPIGEDFKVFTDLRIPQSNFANLAPHDWIFITSKVYSLETLLLEYKDIFSKHGSLVLIQNGIGNEDLVTKFLPNVRVYRILTTNGALLEFPGRVRHTGTGYTKIGFPKSNTLSKDESRLHTLVTSFEGSSLSTELESNIDVLLWEKIFVNVGINAIASIYNLSNGGLLESDYLKGLMREAISEAWHVAQSMDIPLDSTPERYIQFTFSVCEKTKPNRNSMLQDLDNGRNTEIDYINGKIAEYGSKIGIATPVNEDLTRRIKEMENKL